MKGLVLSGGFGTRLRPLTYSQQKQLIPVANKPILFYGIEDLIDAGIKNIGIILGPNKDQVIKTVNSVSWDANIEFIDQDYPLGIAHTIKVAKDFLEGDSFIMYLGDNILREGVVDHVKKFEKSNYEGSILLTEVDNPEDFGVAFLNDKKEIVKILEKPNNPQSNLAVIGIYLFRSKIFEAVDQLKPSNRNLLEITDAIQWLIDNNYKVVPSLVKNWWKDTGKPEDILHANRLILDDINSFNQGKVVISEIRGRVQIGEGTVVDSNSMVKGPVLIGKKCKISDSYIGPYTSIGDNCEIIGSEIEDSVLFDNVSINNTSRIIDSLIGKGVKIFKNKSLPEGKRFVIGDNSEVCV
jgi:glucose-1-phosphate thymidylyltransferase